MDVDKPQRSHSFVVPHGTPTSGLTPALSCSDQSDSRRAAPSNGNGSQAHALPPRPAMTNSNGVPPRPTDTADLRDKVIASRTARISSTMDPPPAPNSSARPVDSSSKRDSPSSSDRLNSSRAASPRGSDAGRRSDRTRASSRDRVDDSSSRREREKDPKDSRDRERTSSNKDSRSHEGHRSSRHDDEDRRKATSSSHRDSRPPTERTAERSGERERPTREDARRLEDKPKDERREERRRDERLGPSATGSGNSSSRPPREHDRGSSTAGAVHPSRNSKDEPRFSTSNVSFSLVILALQRLTYSLDCLQRVESSRGPAPPPHRGDSNSLGDRLDRLKPAPAARLQSASQSTSSVPSGPVGIPPSVEGSMIIRGRGLGNARVFENAMRAPDRHSSSTGRGVPDDAPMSSSARRDGEDSKKRPAPPASNAALLCECTSLLCILPSTDSGSPSQHGSEAPAEEAGAEGTTTMAATRCAPSD